MPQCKQREHPHANEHGLGFDKKGEPNHNAEHGPEQFELFVPIGQKGFRIQKPPDPLHN